MTAEQHNDLNKCDANKNWSAAKPSNTMNVNASDLDRGHGGNDARIQKQEGINLCLTPLLSDIRVTNSSHCVMIASGGASPSTKGQSFTSMPSLPTRVAS